MPIAQIWLVEPRVRLFGQNAGDALAIEVDPLVYRAVQADWQVFQADRIELANIILNGGLAVLELNGRQRLFDIGQVGGAVALDRRLGIIAHEPRLGDGANERGKARTALMG